MFGLFKRTKIESWEIELLSAVLKNLPSEFSYLTDQIENGLFRGVLTEASDIPGYVAFTFNSNVLKRYDKHGEMDYKLTNINVYDRKSMSFLSYSIYVSSGTINGYSLNAHKSCDIDINKIDVSRFKKEFSDDYDYKRIEKLFNNEEKTLLNPSEIYSVIINDSEYFHIKDLEDGDFIGIDQNNIIYRITHDPQEAVALDRSKLGELIS